MRILKITELFIILLFVINETSFSQTIKPNQITGLLLWLRADSNVVDSAVSQWSDCSGNTNNAIQNTPANQPVKVNNIAYLNNMPAINFNGANQFLNGTQIANINNSSMSVFIICNGTNYAVGDYWSCMFQIGCYPNEFNICVWANNQSFDIANTGQGINGLYSAAGFLPNSGFNYKMLEYTKDFNVSSKIFSNGTLLNSVSGGGQVGTFTNGNYGIGLQSGGCYTNYYSGNIAEILIYNQALSTTDRQAVENYLHNKYAPPVNLGKDTTLNSFCNYTLHAGKRFLSYLWSTGATTDSIVISNSGTYSVTATDVFGFTSSDTVKVTYPQMTLHDTTFCAGSSVTLSTGLAGAYTYLWSNSLTTSAINVNTAGNYSVTITDASTCSAVSPVMHLTEDSFPITASLGPDVTICSGNTISLISPAPLPFGLTYLWTGGATTTSLTIASSGNYAVTVTDKSGCSANDNINITVSGIAPTPTFNYAKACAGLATQFNDVSSTPKDNWLWDFGDAASSVNDTSTSKNPSHIYNSSGNYIVSLTVGNGVCKNTITKTIHIPASPVAAFIVDTTCISKPYTFTDNSSCSEGHVNSWLWNFGDSHFSHSQDTSYRYTVAGNYTVTLTIATDSGCTATASHQITVVSSAPSPMPFTIYLPSNGYITSSHTVNFAWNASQGAASYTLEYSPDSLFSNNVTSIPNINLTSFQQNITTSQKYFWHVIAYGICGNPIISKIRSFTIFSPLSVAGTQLWLRADSALTLNDTLVTQWSDCSGNTNNAIQNTPANQPVKVNNIAYLNNMPAINFNGANQFLNGTQIANINNSSMSVFIICNGTNYAVGDYWSCMFQIGCYPNEFNICIWAKNQSFEVDNTGGGVDGLYSATGFLPNFGFNYKMLEYTKDFNVSSKIFSNGILLNSVSGGAQVGTFTNGNYGIGVPLGGCYTNYYSGDIAEILVYNQALNTADRQTVENYLHNKYAPPVNLGHDITKSNFCPDTLDAGDRFLHYKWNTGNSADTLHYLVVNTAGTYAVTATDVFGFTSTDTVKVSYPIILLHDTTFCAGSSVTLSTGLSGAYTYLWSNALTTSTINVNTAGNYSVTITDGSSCSAVSPIIHVSVDNLPLKASLGHDTSICSGNTIGLVSPMPLPSGLTYHWSDSETTSTIAIDTAGTYSLTVSDGYGCIASDNITIGIAGTAPSISFTYQKACSGDTTKFTNTSTPVGTSWLWNFGDTQTSNAQNPHHVYSAGGNYNVTLKVLDGICSNVYNKTIHIPKSPVAAFTVDTACINNPFTFTDSSKCSDGHINSWLWSFGDGNFSHQQDTTYKYTAAGTYTVSLTITTDSGCTASTTHQITVVSTAPSPLPFTIYLPSNKFISSSHTINFAWNASQGAASYKLEYSTDSLFASNVTSIPNISLTSSQQNIIIAQTYYWRVIAFNLCGASTLSKNYYSFSIFSPDTISGLTLWLKADAGIDTSGNFVKQWNDQSSYANNASQADSLQQPQLIYHVPLLNNLPSIKFNGVNQFFNGTQIANINNSSMSVFIICNGTNYTVGDYWSCMFQIGCYPNEFNICIWAKNQSFEVDNTGGGVDGLYSATGFLPNFGFNYKMLEYTKDFNVSSKIFSNGILLNSVSGGAQVGTFTNGNYGIGVPLGGCYTNYYSGNIAEMIIYNQALSTTDRQAVENYLHNKYAPPVNLGPDITTNNLCPITLEAGNRFVHYKWNTGNVADTLHNLVVNTGGTYIVTATDVFGFKSSDTVIVHKPAIAAHDTMGCYGNSITLNSGLSAPYTFSWNNGSTANSITVTAPSNDTLTVTDLVGCSATRIIHVSADSFSVKSSLGTLPITKCAGDSVYLVNGAGAAVSYDWWDGVAHTHETAYQISWISGNNHPLTLTVNDTLGCTATFNVNISALGAQPKVGFSFVPVCYPGLTTFNDTSSAVTGNIKSHYWDFGDASVAFTTSPSHDYSSDGYYTVTLIDSTNQGCYKSVTHQVPVYSVPKPAFMPHLACSGVPVDLKDKSTSLVGNVNIWSWKINDPFGVNNTSTINNITHSFDSTGYYGMKLIVTTQYGCKDSITDSVSVRFAPKIGFSYTSVCDGNPVYFNDTTNTLPWASITHRHWNFGNGDSSAIINPVVIYNGAGIYNVSLTENIINGCVVTDTTHVVVHAIPVAKFTANDICAESPYAFYDSSTVAFPDTVALWLWNFGNGNISNVKNPVTVFPDSNAYFVSLNITTNAGCKDSALNKVHINPIPKASFMPDNFYGVAPFAVTFINNSQGAINYLWDFGDSSSNSIDHNPLHTYLANGIYNVDLIVYNQYGCKSDTAQQLMVIPTIGDIAVSNVNFIKAGSGYDSLSAEITNLGSRRIYQMNIYAKTENGTSFMETWTNYNKPLEPGVSMTYTFNELYKFSTASHYVCVEAEITNYNPDDNPLNNEQCITDTNQFSLINSYPNPVHDELNINFILPTTYNNTTDVVMIELYGTKGEKLKTIYPANMTTGLNKYILDVSDLDLAFYTYRITYNGNVLINKFVKY